MKSKFFIALCVFVIAFIYWQWWSDGPRVANDFSWVSLSNIKLHFNLPQTWSMYGTEGLGEYAVFTLWSWPFTFFQGILANLNISFELMQRFLFIVAFLFIGGSGIWKLCKNLGLSNFSIIISVIFYLTNTYIILLIDGGQLSIGLSYSIFPWAFMFFEKSIYGSLKKKILAGLIVWTIGIFDIRFIYVFFILCIIKFAYDLLLIKENWHIWFLNYFKTGLIIIIILAGLNAYWILVLIKFPISSNFYENLTKTSFTSFISLSNAILLLSPHWYKNIFGQLASLRFEFFLIPVLVFLAPIFKKRNKAVGFWLVVALISVFLTKGTSEPLPGVYQWFYYNIPGFSLFRDSSKFFFLVALSYTVLIGITLDEIQKRISKSKMKFLGAVVIGVYFVLLSRPVWLNQMTGTFSQPILQKEYSDLNKFIKNSSGMSNVFWIPTISPMTELDFYHPAVEAARLVQKRPFAQGAVGSYEIFNFLREAPYMGQLFDVASIGYIIYPPLDLRRADKHPDNIRYYQTFLSQLSNLSWLSKIDGLSIPIFKVKQQQERIFISSNIWWIIGSDDIYKESTKSASLSLHRNAFIFPEEIKGLGEKINDIPDSKIILNGKTLIDLAAIKLIDKNLIFPSQQLNRDPDSSGWWKRDTSEFIAWRDFLKNKYDINNQDFDFGGGLAVSEGSLNLKIKNDKIKNKNILLARVMESSRGGDLRFYQGDNKIGDVSTISSGKSNIRWFEVGSLVADNEIRVDSEGDINVVNALASLSVSDWDKYKKDALVMKDRIVDFKGENVSKDISSVKYNQISPTKYIIQIENLQKPSMVIFSQNYNKNWKLNGQTPFLVYSFLNGFIVDKNGSYELSFEPQRFIPLTLGFSVVVFILCIIFLIL